MDLGLRNRTVIITGAASGIGKGVAQKYAEEGANLALADINLEGLEVLKAEFESAGVKTFIFKLDVTNADACKEFVDGVHKEFGRIDVLFNNAGTALMGDILTFPEETFRKHAELMMYAPMRLMNLCIPYFKENGWGSIVTTSSVYGKQPGGLLSYDVIKAADLMLSKEYANYCAEFNINVNAICPGPVETPLWYAEGQLGDQLSQATGMEKKEAIEWFAKTNIPMGRFSTVEEIGDAVVFLSSERAHYITGTSLNIDGGMIKTCF